MAHLGIWKVVTQHREGLPPVFQITRNGEAVDEPYIFKGHAVAAKGRYIRSEGLAVQERIRAGYADTSFVKGKK